MGWLDPVSDFLFGKEEKAASSPLGELFNQIPELRDLAPELVQQFIDVAGGTEAYMPSEIAPLSTLEQEASKRAMQELGWNPQFGFGQDADKAFATAQELMGGVSPLIQKGMDYYAGGAAPITQKEFGGAYDMFFDPYTEDVIRGVEGDIGRERDLGLSYARGATSDIDAFGGTRGALMESEVMRNAADILGQQTSQLRSAGYQSAVDQAMGMLTGEKGRQMQAGAGAVGAAGTQAGAAGTAGALGTGLMGARETVSDIETQNIQNALGIGGLERGIDQAELMRAAEVAGIPLDQLQTLSSLFGVFPTGGAGGTKGTSGLVSDVGTSAAGGLAKIAFGG